MPGERLVQCALISGYLTAMCRISAPNSSHATAKCTGTKENGHGYHWTVLSSPVNSWKTAAATRTATERRSSAWRTDLSAGHTNSRGYTAHSLANSSGIAAMPLATCSPCVTR